MAMVKRNRNMLVLWLAGLLFLVGSQPGWGQRSKMMSVYVRVMRPNTGENADEVPMLPVGRGCKIYVFRRRSDAAKYYNRQKELNSLDAEGSGITKDVGDVRSYEEEFETGIDGACELSPVGSDWYIVAFRETGKLFSKGVVPIANRMDIEIVTEPVDQMLREHVKTGKLNIKSIEARPRDCGDRRSIQASYTIPSDETDATFRYGIAPFCNEVAGEDYGFTSAYQHLTPKVGKTFKRMRPYVMDGERYHSTQYRKMGFAPEEHDPMERYVKAQKVKTRDKDTVSIQMYEELHHIKPNTFYPVWAYRWYENYGSLVKGDTLLLDNGYRHDRTQFLDYSFPEVDIHREMYERKPRKDVQEGKANLQIEFVRGQAEVLPSDSSGLQQLRDIMQKLEAIHADRDASLYYVQIHGYASPEGGRATNESLCRQRAGYLQRQILARLVGVPSDVEGSVASWADVAKLLRQDSISDPENVNRAKQIEDIIASSGGAAQTDARMQASPLYQFLKENEDKYYKPLRKVEISYEYSQRRELSREEVIARYEKKEELAFPYQYTYLFEYLKDRPKELGEVAAKAMRLEREPTGKPWTLAAYYLAKSYTDRNMCDTTILQPYITKQGEECYKAYPGSMLKRSFPSTLLNAVHVTEEGDEIQLMNDEGIVIQQILMYLKADRINDAFLLSDVLLPDEDARYVLPKKMLECRCDGWNKPEVRDLVASTSDWNRVVVYAAQDGNPNEDPEYWKGAWSSLNDSAVFHMTSARELYMKAILALRLYDTARNWNGRTDKTPVPTKFFDLQGYSVFDHPPFNDDAYPWGAVMVKACEMEPTFIEMLKFDGEFSQNYRDGFAAYWNEIHPDKILK